MQASESATEETARYSRLLLAASGVEPGPTNRVQQHLESSRRRRIDLPSWLEEDDLERTIARLAAERPPQSRRELVHAFQLVVRTRDGRTVARQVFLQERVRIGRSPACDLRLDDPTVSRFHAQIACGDGFALSDEKSTNGIKVNGRRVRAWRLNDGDVISVGDFELHFREELVPAFKALEGLVRPDATVGPEAFGKTAVLPPSRRSREHAERTLSVRAYLRLPSPTARVWPRSVQLVLDRDVYVVGADAEADLRLTAWWAPRIAGVIVRGPSGFSLDPVAWWPRCPWLNGRPVRSQVLLEDGDEVSFCGERLTFHLDVAPRLRRPRT